MAKAERRGARVLWADLCRDSDYRGRWVALHAVRYDGSVPVEGELVDADEDLAALCARIQSAEDAQCAILFCDDKASGVRRAIT